MRKIVAIIIAIAIILAGVAVLAALFGGSSKVSPSNGQTAGGKTVVTLPPTTTTTTTRPLTKKEIVSCSQSAEQLSTFLREHPQPGKGGGSQATIARAEALYGSFVTDCKSSPVIVSVVTRVQMNPWRKKFGLSELAVPSAKA